MPRYNPNVGRFINADSLFGNIGQLKAHNLFNYCDSNPVNRQDQNGYIWDFLDIAFAVWSWGEFLAQPGWGTLGWALADTAGCLSIVPSPSYATRSGKLFKRALNQGAKFRKFTKSNFRHNVIQLIGKAPSWMNKAQAHHVFPQATKFSSFFKGVGINVHNPIYGSWVEKASHNKWSKSYEKDWMNFIKSNPNANLEQVLNMGKSLAGKYGFEIHY